MDPNLARELAIARDLHARLVPRLGRRARRRLGPRDVLAVLRTVTDDPMVLAEAELRMLVEELLVRGRTPDGQKVRGEDLVAEGLEDRWLTP